MPDLAELLARRAELEQQIENLQSSARGEAIDQIRALMEAHGLTIADIQQKAAARKSKAEQPSSKTVAAKYRHPETGETWSGRGLKPRWLKSQIEAGKSLEDFAV